MRAIGCNGELPFPWWFSGWAWSFPSLDSGDVRDLNPTPGLHLSPETFGTVTDRGVGWRETKTERKTWTTLKLLITEGFHRSVLCLFIDNMPLIGCTPFYLSIHQLVNIWIVSTFCLLWIVLLWTLVHKLFLWTCFHFSMYIHLGVELLVTHMVTLFKLLKNCQTVFHMGCTILHSHQLVMRIPVSPHPLRHLLFSVFLILVISVGVRWFGFPFPVILSIFSCAFGLFLIFVEETSA